MIGRIGQDPQGGIDGFQLRQRLLLRIGKRDISHTAVNISARLGIFNLVINPKIGSTFLKIKPDFFAVFRRRRTGEGVIQKVKGPQPALVKLPDQQITVMAAARGSQQRFMDVQRQIAVRPAAAGQTLGESLQLRNGLIVRADDGFQHRKQMLPDQSGIFKGQETDFLLAVPDRRLHFRGRTPGGHFPQERDPGNMIQICLLPGLHVSSSVYSHWARISKSFVVSKGLDRCSFIPHCRDLRTSSAKAFTDIATIPTVAASGRCMARIRRVAS